MTEQEKWVHFRKIDWDCPNNNRFNVDTRDFHCGYRWDDSEHPNIGKLLKYPDFFHSKDELVTLIERLFVESGGDGEWRLLELEATDERVRNWNLKYLRIFRTELGFIVCNSDNVAIPKRILASEINKEHLCHH
jgi:hypothetical protein